MRAALISLAICLSVVAYASPDLKKLAMARSDEAGSVYKTAVGQWQGGKLDLDRLYVWSVRWLDARIDEGITGKELTQALADHAKRMHDLETMVSTQFRAGLAGAIDVEAAAYYRTEADFWVSRGKR